MLALAAGRGDQRSSLVIPPTRDQHIDPNILKSVLLGPLIAGKPLNPRP